MADKTTFTPEEWSTLRDAPQLVALAVATSGASGVFGTIKEAFSSSAALVEGMKSTSPLISALCNHDEIVAGQQGLKATLPELKGGDAEAMKQKLSQLAVDKVRAAVAAVEGKGTPQDVEAYRTFLKGLGERVAQAAKEGGFLGFGGERVSEREKRMLAAIESALAKQA